MGLGAGGVVDGEGEREGEADESSRGKKGMARVRIGWPVFRDERICEVGVVVIDTSEGCS